MLWLSLSPEPEPTCATALSLKQNATTIPLAESQLNVPIAAYRKALVRLLTSYFCHGSPTMG
ncbi:hypothetical protein ARMSODRAFT_952244 [Armillaria solidipes]|uniref:Uncharacterized protein n=1 Tax=Armillaria solidipes TaxID=1076256 RepID=A0A2H3BQX5_9AGAR|nr:hypothetical protein ARMSODRAFT_960446 [Armillaria solidipes]PBK73249.1 hypothetical protein ARMSODRAFT_952244 [Armillaria solidipes]